MDLHLLKMQFEEEFVHDSRQPLVLQEGEGNRHLCVGVIDIQLETNKITYCRG
jgi:hypothetical protein